MSDLRGIWLDDVGKQHAVTVKDGRFNAARTEVQGAEVFTDCGLAVPSGSTLHSHMPVTCDDCLWGGLDGTLGVEAREPVLAGAGLPPRPVLPGVRPDGEGWTDV